MLPTTAAPEQKTSAPVRPAWERVCFLICELAVFAWVARDLVRQAIVLPRRIAAPFQFDYEEGNILNALARIAHGLTPYPDPHEFPNVLNPYGPVAYYLLVIPVKLFGLSFGHARVVIVASVVAICVLLALTILKLGGSRVAAAAFGLMFPTLVVVRGWIWLLRVDFLALALSLAGLYLFCWGFAKEDVDALGSIDNRQSTIGNSSVSSASAATKPQLVVAAALLVAAICVKYTFLAAPAACVLYLLLERRWKQAARFAAILAALAGAALALTAGLTRGTIFTHLFLSHPDPFSWPVYLLRTSRMFTVHRPLVALAAGLLLSGLAPRIFLAEPALSGVEGADAGLRRRVLLPVLWLLLSTASAITSGKLGSGWNHYLEWSAALCLCAGLGFSVLMRLQPRVLALAATAGAMVWVSVFMLQRPAPPPDPFAPVQGCPQAYAFVREQAGERVLSENVGALVLAGKTVWVSNPYVLNQMVTRAGWSDKPLEDMLRQRRFQAVLLNQQYPSQPYFLEHGTDRFSPQVLRAMAENYRLSKRFQCQDAAFVYLPVN